MAANKGGLVAAGTVEGTGAQIDVDCGFDVGYVKAFNYDDAGGLAPMIEWWYGMTNFHGLKTVEDQSLSITIAEKWHHGLDLAGAREVLSNDIPNSAASYAALPWNYGLDLTTAREVLSNDIPNLVASYAALPWFQDLPMVSAREILSNDIPSGQYGIRPFYYNVDFGSVREVFTNDITNIAANGGILAKDTTPVLEFTNGDVDSAIRLNWVAGNVDPIAFTVALPKDFDTDSDLTLYIEAQTGANDTGAFTVESFFTIADADGETYGADTKVSDTTGAMVASKIATLTATIAAADIPTGAVSVSIELIPAAHGSDAVYVYGISLAGTLLGAATIVDGGVLSKTSSPVLEYTNGDVDSAIRLNWSVGNVDKIAYTATLPANLDETKDLTLSLLLETGATDTTGWTVESFFTIADTDGETYAADTKVSDTTTALVASKISVVTATIAAADIPANARQISLELTPSAHAADPFYLYGASLTGTLTASSTVLNGGLLGKDTTPALEYPNGDTDSAIRLNWVAGNVDPITFTVPLPSNLNEAADLTLNLAIETGATDTTGWTIESFFTIADADGETYGADTKVTDTTSALVASKIAVVSATIAAADIPANAVSVSFECIPAAHAADAQHLFAANLVGTLTASAAVLNGGILGKDTTPSLEYTNGDTDSAIHLRWVAGNTDKIAYSVPLPSDLTLTSDLTLKMILQTGSTDTTGWTVESFFTIADADGETYTADTKVTDTSGALVASKVATVSTTIAAADIPAKAVAINFEITPAAHASDIQYLYGIWLEGTRGVVATATAANQMSLAANITSGGLAAYNGTATQKGFSIGTDSDLNVNGETICWYALERWS